MEIEKESAVDEQKQSLPCSLLSDSTPNRKNPVRVFAEFRPPSTGFPQCFSFDPY
jgi:hypothetical protein